MSLYKKLYYFGLWLLGNKLGLMGGDSLTVEIQTKVPASEYEALARSFLPYILEYFSKEENMKDYEEWKAKRKGQKKTSVQA